MDTQQVYINAQEMSKWDSQDENIYMNEAPEDMREAEAPQPVASEGLPLSPHRGARLRAAAAAIALLSALLLAALILLVFTWVTLNTRTKEMRAAISNLTGERGLLQSSNIAMETFNRNLSGRMMRMETEKLQLQDRLTALSAERDQLRRLIETLHCHDPWVRFHNSCYLLSPNPKNWTDSRQDCEEQGARLVIITSPEEQKFVSSLTAQCVWIGLTDRDTEDEWRWVNGDNVTSPTYWRPKQLDNWRGDEDCREICGERKWNDKKCSITKHFICETESECLQL